MQVPDDVWSKVLVHHGPLRLVQCHNVRKDVASTRIQRAWRHFHPGVGDVVNVLIGKEWKRGVVIHATRTDALKWWTVRLRKTPPCRYVFMTRALTMVGKEGRHLSDLVVESVAGD